MALDKQRILHELGSVMNQLQSAECGCMEKMFSNSNENQFPGSPLPTCGGCRRGTCAGHGYPTSCAGEPHLNNSIPGGGRTPYIDRCNAPKLYADTYSYLNQNLMQPVINEVYNDLSSITPANTIGNNNLANQMGLTPQGDPGTPLVQGKLGGGQNRMPSGGNVMNSNPQPQMDPMGGMGAHIVNMMLGSKGNTGGMGNPGGMGSMGNPGGKGGMAAQGGHQLTESMLITAPQSPHGQIGVTPLTQTMGANQGQYNADNFTQGNMGQANIDQGNIGQGNIGQGSMGQENNMAMQPTTQYNTKGKMILGANAAGNPLPGNMTQYMNTGIPQAVNMNENPAAPQMGIMKPNYGQHTPGIAKFNEMFPGIMQEGSLGFDPMAIAIQMNPKNQQRAALETMTKLMNNEMPGAQTGANFSAPPSQSIQQQHNVNPNRELTPNQQNITPTGQVVNKQASQGQQQQANPNAGVVPQQQQQVYTAVTGAPMMNQKIPQQQMQDQQLIQQQQLADLNMAPDPNAQTQQFKQETESFQPLMETFREPIYPSDSSKNKPLAYMKPHMYFHFNTLGQPVEKLPRTAYHTSEPALPQTLSPQPTERLRNYHSRISVKAASVSGGRPSTYQPYKGSASYTQNIKSPGQGATYSEGTLRAPPTNLNPGQTLVEKVGGDTMANNQLINKVETVLGQIGDSTMHPVSGKTDDLKVCAKRSNCRNGLQDIVFTSYPRSTSWSFHGDNRARS